MNKKCRFCDVRLEKVFVDLGTTPLSNAFLEEKDLNQNEDIFPLKVYVCEKCFLVQLPEWQIPSEIFSNYAYFSSYSESWLKHAENYVEKMLRKFNLNKKFVIEIASNDGYLLQYFKKEEINILGIEPAENVADVAIKKGIPTLKKFFNSKMASELKDEGKQADLIIGNNVFAHVPNLNDFVEGLSILLKKDGIITLEFPHLLKLINLTQFDTIYHEHFSYFSLFVVKKIVEKFNLEIFDVEELSTHGGSLRVFLKHVQNKKFHVTDNVISIIKEEENSGLAQIETYEKFSDKVKKIKEDLNEFFDNVKNENKKVVCYGAAAKGNTLLNYCGISKNSIMFIVDRNKHKQGLFLPGTHIVIKNPKEVKNAKPDYILILPWNLKDEVMQQMDFIKEWGGKFVIPIPEVRIIS